MLECQYQKGVNKEMKLSLNCHDEVHKKIKVIATLTNTTINAITENLYQEFISNYENEHGEIRIPD